MASFVRIRNNTNFPLAALKTLHEIERSYAKDSDPLQYHQRLVVEYLMHYPGLRGLLAYHMMGSGKSILAAAICEAMHAESPKKRIVFFASKSLHENFRENIAKYLTMVCKAPENDQYSLPVESDLLEKLRIAGDTAGTTIGDVINTHIDAVYTFISLNASNLATQVTKASKTDGVDLGDLFMDVAVATAEKHGDEIDEFDNVKKIGDLNDSCVIIDEAHNFFNAVVNGSNNAAHLYNLLYRAHSIKIILLTGSVIVNDPFEAAVAYNLIAPRGHDDTPLFGESHEDFMRYFVENADGMLDQDGPIIPKPRMKNVDKFMARIVGLTSYYPAQDLADQFPELLEMQVETCPMSTKQYAAYSEARDQELETGKRGVFKKVVAKPLQKNSSASASYRVRSRQFGNMLYPPHALKQERNKYGRIVTSLDASKLTKEDFTKAALDEYSPKVVKMLGKVALHGPESVRKVLTNFMPKEPAMAQTVGRGPGIIYSQFRDAGILYVGKALEAHGFVQLTTSEQLSMLDGQQVGGRKPAYIIVSGDVEPEVRAQLLAAFNSPENLHGELIAVMLFTAVGAEGISTKGVRYVLFMEPFWHWTRFQQVFFRAVRLGSHLQLPVDQRTVKPYIFLAEYPDHVVNATTGRPPTEPTTDVSIYLRARQKQAIIEEFLAAIRRSAIDCAIWGKDCFLCEPTDRLLFVSSLDKDMLAAPTYRIMTVAEAEAAIKSGRGKIKVTEVMVDGKKYFISADDRIFRFNEATQTYEEIKSGQEYDAILAAR